MIFLIISIFGFGLDFSTKADESDPYTREDPDPLIWHDPTTGIALAGFDPVSYFGSEGPRKGKDQFECPISGAVWQFANKGNLLAFQAKPEKYLPQFGGYDAYGMARDLVVEVNPTIWIIVNKKLYLFHSRQAKAAWLENPAMLKTLAYKNWRKMLAQKSKSKIKKIL